MKKISLVILSTILMASIALTTIGCNSANEKNTTGSEATTKSDAANTEAASGLPIVTDGTTITIACVDNWYAQAPYTPELPVFKELIKRTGVQIKFEALPDDQYWKSMSVRAAAGSDLPDLFTLPDDPMKYGSQGIIMPLEDLIEQYGPNIKTVMAEAPALAKYMKKGDGHIWAFPQYIPGDKITTPSAPLIIRKDWVEKVGMKMPVTTAELTEVLYAFKEKLNVQIPMTCEYGGMGGLVSYAPLFGLSIGWDPRAAAYYYWTDDHKKLVNQFTAPEMKEFVAWLAKLYKDGILDKEFAQSNTDTMIAKMTSGKTGLISMNWAHNIPQFNTQSRDAGQNGADWYALEPTKPSNGSEPFIDVGTGFNGQFGVSKSSKHADVVVKLMDYWQFSKEGYTLKQFGIEGLSYTKDTNGTIHFTDFVAKNPDKLTPRQALWSIGALPNLPVLIPTPSMKSIYVDPVAFVENDPVMQDASKRLSPFNREGLPTFASTADEDKELAQIVADTDTFKNENIMKFVVGQRDMSEWDSFIEQWKKMGLSREEEIWQKMLDRYNEN